MRRAKLLRRVSRVKKRERERKDDDDDELFDDDDFDENECFVDDEE